MNFVVNNNRGDKKRKEGQKQSVSGRFFCLRARWTSGVLSFGCLPFFKRERERKRPKNETSEATAVKKAATESLVLSAAAASKKKMLSDGGKIHLNSNYTFACCFYSAIRPRSLPFFSANIIARWLDIKANEAFFLKPLAYNSVL